MAARAGDWAVRAGRGFPHPRLFERRGLRPQQLPSLCQGPPSAGIIGKLCLTPSLRGIVNSTIYRYTTREVERQNVPYLEGGRQVRCDAYGIGLARLRDLRGGGHTRRHNADQRTWMAATEWAGGVAERELDSLLVSGLGAAEAQRWRDDGRARGR